MKRFLIKTGWFLLPLLILAIAMEVLLRVIPNDYTYKKAFLDENSKKVEALFLGTSHAYYGINPEFISGKAFNASHVSQSIDYDYEIIMKYKNNWDQLKYIAVPIDYATLFSRLSMGDGSWRIKNYEIYYDIDKEPGLVYNSEVFSVQAGLNLKRLYKYYLKREPAITCSDLGYGSIEREPGDLVKTGKTAAKRHTKSNKEFFEENVLIVKEIIDFALKNNIKVLFYTSPAYHTYTSHLDKEQLNRTLMTINAIVENNKNSVYHNFLNDTSFTADDFNDADHLNYQGAKKLSQKLNYLMYHKSY